MHFPGAPVEPDWTKALGVFSEENPGVFGTILLIIAIAEGESVGHSGDNFRGKSTKTDGSDLNFDYLGLKKKQSPEKFARYQEVELKVRPQEFVGIVARINDQSQLTKFLFSLVLQNGRAAMIAMASLFSWKAIPGSVPIMDILA